MKALWRPLFEQLSAERTIDQARRAANFLLAAILSEPGKTPAPTRLCARADELAKTIASPIRIGKPIVRPLLELLRTLAPVSADRSQFDSWVEAFQSADGRRKNLGAFATPSAFADALASSLLPAGHIPAAYRVVDPSAGAGNLLAAVYQALVGRGIAPEQALEALHGMELDPAARELCILHLWLLTPAPRPPLEAIAGRIRLGNALTHDWWSDGPPFDGLIMNPPWESLRHGASCASVEAERLATLDRLTNPKNGAQGLPPLYSCHGRGDRNLFKAFVELAPHLLRDGGRLSALVPAAFGSDDGMANLRRFYLRYLGLQRWTTFENRGGYFAIDSRYKFGILKAARSEEGTSGIAIRSFCTQPEEVAAPHIVTTVSELSDLFGTDVMIPELTSAREWEILHHLAAAGDPFLASPSLGPVRYRREVDLTLGRATGRFIHVEEAAKRMDQGRMVPLLEGRMVGQYDCFQKSFVGGAGRTAVWEANGERPACHCRSQYVAPEQEPSPGRVAICDITSATNSRTMLATLVPDRWLCGNTAPVLRFESEQQALAGLVILNSLTFDWMARRIMSGLHLNKFYLAHLRWPRLTPDEVEQLSALGRVILASVPRGGGSPLPGDPSARVGRMDALIEAEIQVIRAFGLADDQVSMMLADDRSDRRGFWRFYAGSSEGRELAEAVLDRLRTRSLLAA